MANKTDNRRSWFCVLNNPQNIFGDLSPDEMVNRAIDLWCEDKPTRSCGVNFEIGESRTPHMHMVLEDSSKVRFSTIQKLFKGIHIEPTRGSKEQALDYINKRGAFEEKAHTVVVPAAIRGEIKSNQGKRKDMEIIQDMIEKGMTPNEIYDSDIRFRQYEKCIKSHYYRKRYLETPSVRDVKVYWHLGESGSGKSYTYVKLVEKLGADKVFFLNDYDNGGFDTYNGEEILFMDEFKGNIKFSVLLGLLDKYRVQVHCRYSNVCSLWSEVHITSVLAPEDAYRFMVSDDVRDKDKVEQLLRRIYRVVYHYKDGALFYEKEMSVDEYKKTDFMPFVSESSCSDNPFGNGIDAE